MNWSFGGSVAWGFALLTLVGCGERKEYLSAGDEAACPMNRSQRFLSGDAAPGEFVTLQGLPPVPASFEEAEQ